MSKFSGDSVPYLHDGSAARLLENASNSLIFVKNFPGASPPTPTRVLPLDRWKMLQKHLFLSKFSGSSVPYLHKGSASRLLENASKALTANFCQNFLGASPLTPTRAQPPERWKMLQKHLFLSTFSGAPSPTSTKARPPDCWKMLQKH